MKPIQQHVLEWLEALRIDHYSPRSIQTYGYRIRRFAWFLEEQGVKDVGLVDRDLLRRFWGSLTKDHAAFSVNSLGCECRAVKSFFAHLNRSGVMSHDPAAVLVDPSRKFRKPVQAPDYAEVKKVLEAPDTNTPQGIRDRAVLELLFSSAIRVGECENLLLGDVDLADGVLRVREGKGGKGRVVPLGVTACHWVHRYLEQARPFYKIVLKRDHEHLFLGRFGGRMNTCDIRKAMQRYREQAGVSDLVTPHGLRRAAATGMVSRVGKQAADLEVVQQLLGHSRPDVTARYAQMGDGDVKDAHGQTHPRAKTATEEPRPILRVRPRHA